MKATKHRARRAQLDGEEGPQIAAGIKAARLDRELTMDTLARKAGITRSFLSKLERGEKAPAISTLINLANALHAEVSELIGEGQGATQRLSGEEVERSLGHRLRQARQSRGITIDALARKAGITKGFLAKIERGEKTPAISTLVNIASALPIEVAKLLEPARQDVRISHVKRLERPPAVTHKSGYGYKYVALADKFTTRRMEPFIVTVPRNPKQRGPGFTHPGEEFVMVLKGKIILAFGAKEYVLDEGDSAYFDSSIPHWPRSANGKESETLDISFVATE